MSYSVEFTIQAEEDLARLDKTIAQHIANKIDWLSQSIKNIIPAPLRGKFKGKFKLRAGDWRIIYSFEHSSQSITIYADSRQALSNGQIVVRQGCATRRRQSGFLSAVTGSIWRADF